MPLFSLLPLICLVAWVAPVRAGDGPNLSELTDLLRRQPEASWLKLNRNSVQEAFPAQSLMTRLPAARSYRNPLSVFIAWAGFAWDSKRGQLLIWGGGHGDYAGNEMYRWSGVTRRWERASLPSELRQPLPDQAAVLTVDGPLHSPVAGHPYDTPVYLPVLDRFLMFSQSLFPDGGGSHKRLDADGRWIPTGPYLFDPARADADKTGGLDGSGPDPRTPGGRMWQNRDLYSVMKTRGVRYPERYGIGAADSRVENGQDVVYLSAAYGGGVDHHLFRYRIPDLADPSRDLWEMAGRSWSNCGCMTVGALDRDNNLFVRTGQEAGKGNYAFTYWDLDRAGPQNRSVGVPRSEIQGAPEFVMNDRYGMDYDPPRKRLLLWSGGPQVWALTIRKKERRWEIAALPAASPGGAPAPSRVGVLGKWKYLAGLDIFIALEDDGDVWAYKPSGWLDPARIR